MLLDTGASVVAADSPTDVDAGASGLRWIRRLVAVNLGIVALQALSAGLFLSGDGRGVTAHAAGAVAVQAGALVQAITAIVLWRRGRVPASVARFSLALLAMVFLQAGVGYSKRYWLHVPIGVGIFGGLTRQWSRLGLTAPSPAPGSRRRTSADSGRE